MNDDDSLDLGLTVRGFSAGQKVFHDRYTLRRTLGRGGMGVVWLAWDEQLEREVGLKFLPESVTADRMALDDLRRETLKGLQLNHHHIVRIYDFLRHDAWAGISMEYVDGDNFSNLRVERPNRLFTVEEMRVWTGQLCEALEYAHTKAKLVHRDLKPANLMVNSAGDLKVADFGISSSISESVSRVSMRMTTGGTLAYMSPQQLDGEPARVTDDVYALGATLYDLLTTRPPFYQGNVDRQVHEKRAVSLTQRLSDLGLSTGPIPAEWEETISACLEKDPGQRPQSAGEVAWRLGLARDYARVAAPASTRRAVLRVPRPEPKPSAAPRGKAVLLSTLVALVVAGLVAGWWFGVLRPNRVDEPTVATPKAVADEVERQRIAVQAEKDRLQEEEKRLAAEQRQAEAKRQGEVAQAEKDFANAMVLERGVSSNLHLDKVKAIELMQKAAAHQLAEAEADLAAYYESGEIVSKDEGKARELATLALAHGLEAKAAANNIGAEVELAGLYKRGLGVEKDLARAFELFRRAAQAGNAEAKVRTGKCYEKGDGVPQDYAKAVELYREVAETGDAEAQNNLAACYRDGKGVPKDPAMARALFEKASARGDAFSEAELAFLYEQGDSVPQNYDKAAELYRKAADQGDTFAMNRLGGLYETGHGVLADFAKAAELYRQSADGGYAMGQYNLGRLYETGRGVSKDLETALALYKKAAALGNEPAKKKLAAWKN